LNAAFTDLPITLPASQNGQNKNCHVHSVNLDTTCHALEFFTLFTTCHALELATLSSMLVDLEVVLAASSALLHSFNKSSTKDHSLAVFFVKLKGLVHHLTKSSVFENIFVESNTSSVRLINLTQSSAILVTHFNASSDLVNRLNQFHQILINFQTAIHNGQLIN